MNVCLPCGPPGSPASIVMRIDPPFSGSLNFGSNPPRSRKRDANGSVSKEDWERETICSRADGEGDPQEVATGADGFGGFS